MPIWIPVRSRAGSDGLSSSGNPSQEIEKEKHDGIAVLRALQASGSWTKLRTADTHIAGTLNSTWALHGKPYGWCNRSPGPLFQAETVMKEVRGVLFVLLLAPPCPSPTTGRFSDGARDHDSSQDQQKLSKSSSNHASVCTQFVQTFEDARARFFLVPANACAK